MLHTVDRRVTIAAHIDPDVDFPSLFGGPVVEVAVSCVDCHHRRALLNTYRLTPWWSVLEQVRLLERVLEDETGLPVFIDPPDDPRAGVREPRRPSPSTGSLGASLPLP